MVSLRKLFEYKKACCLFVAAIMVALGAQASASIPAQQVYSYAKNLDYTALRYLGSSIDNEDSSGNTALCIALAKGDRRAYQTLLQYGANRNARCIARRALAQKRMAMASGSSQTFLGMGTTGWLVTGALVAGGIGIAAASGGGGGGGSGGGSGKPQCDGYQQVCPAGYHATEDTCQIGDQTLYKCAPDTCEGYVISCPDGYHPNGEMCRAGDIVMHKCSLNTCSGYVEACPVGYEETDDTCTSGDVLLKKCRAQKCLGYNINTNPMDNPNMHCTDTSSCLSGTEYRYKCNACEKGWVSSDCSKPYQCGDNFKLACVEYDGWVPTGQVCLSGDTEYYGCEPKDCTGYDIPAGTETEHCADLERCKSGDNPATYKCTKCEEGYNFGPDGTCQLISILCQDLGYTLQECNINTQYVADTDYCPYEENLDDGNKHYHRCSRRQNTHNCTAFDPHADICTECREGWHGEDCMSPNICPAEYTDEKCDNVGWVLDDTCYNGDNPKYKCVPAQCEEGYKAECDEDEYPTDKTCPTGDEIWKECKIRQHSANCGEVDPLHDRCLSCISEEFILNESGYCITLNEECADEGYTSEACPTGQYISSKCELSEEYHKCSRRQNTAQCTEFEPEADICTACETGYGIKDGKCVSNGSLCGSGFKTAACATLEYISEVCEIDESYHKCTRRSNTSGCTAFEDNADRCTECATKYILDEATGTCTSTSSLCPGYSSYISCPALQYKTKCEYDASLLKCVDRTRLVDHCRYYTNPEEDNGVCQSCETGYTVSPDGRTCVEDSGGDDCGDEYSTEDVAGCANYNHCTSNYEKKKCTRCNTSRGFIKDPDEYGHCKCSSSSAQIIDNTCVEPETCDDYSTADVTGCHNYIYCPSDASKKKCNQCDVSKGFKYTPNADGSCSCSSETARIIDGVCVESCDDYSTADVPGCYGYDYCPSDSSKKKCRQCNTSKGFKYTPNADGSCSCVSETAEIIGDTCVEPDTCEDYSTSDVTGCYKYNYCPTDSSKKKCEQCNTSKGFKYTPNADGSCSCASETAVIRDGACVETETCEDYSSVDVTGCSMYDYCPTDTSKKKCEQCNTSKGFKSVPDADGRCSCASQTAIISGDSCVEPDACEGYSTDNVTGCSIYNYCPTDSTKKKCTACLVYSGYYFNNGTCVYDSCQYDAIVNHWEVCPSATSANKMCTTSSGNTNPEYTGKAFCCPQGTHKDGDTCVADTTKMCPYEADSLNLDYCTHATECDDGSWKCDGCIPTTSHAEAGKPGECIINTVDYCLSAGYETKEALHCQTPAGTACFADGTNYYNQCSTCQSGYDLVNGKCVLSGGETECPYTEQPASTYCAHSTQCNDGSWKCDACVPTTAHTEAGKPGECIINTTAYCLEAGYETTEALHCQTPTGTPCIADGTNYFKQCSSCQDGYDLVNGKCVEQGTKICPYGATETAPDCATTEACADGSKQCTACLWSLRTSHHISEGRCVANTEDYCHNEGYKADTEMHCLSPAYDSEPCIVNNKTYYLSCLICEDGYEGEQCETCATGYHPDGDKCVADDPTECTDPQPDKPGYCKTLSCVSGEWKCTECTDNNLAYNDDSGECVANTAGYCETKGKQLEAMHCLTPTPTTPTCVVIGTPDTPYYGGCEECEDGYDLVSGRCESNRNINPQGTTIDAGNRTGSFYGMQATSGTLENYGTITDTHSVGANYRYGMHMANSNGPDGQLINNGSIEISNKTSGNTLTGMFLAQGTAQNAASATITLNNNTLNASNGEIAGIKVSNGNLGTQDASNAGTVTLNGNNNVGSSKSIYGIYSDKSVANIGTVEMNNNQSGNIYGIYSYQGTAENSGTIKMQNNTGKVTGMEGSTVINTNKITIDGASTAIGMSGSYSSESNNSGTITLEDITTSATGMDGGENRNRISISGGQKSVGIKNGTNAKGSTIEIFGAANTATGVEKGNNYGTIAISDSNNPIGVKNGSNNGTIIINGQTTGTIYGIYADTAGAYTNTSGSTITIEKSGSNTAYGIYAENVDNLKVTNAGTIDISGASENNYGIYAEGSKVAVTNTGTIIISGIGECSGQNCGASPYIVLNGATFNQNGNLKSRSLDTLSTGGVIIATNTSHFEIENEFSGDLVMSSEVVTDGFDDTYTVENMIDAGDVSGLNLLSQSALFDAELQNESDAVLTMKPFDEVVQNQSVADFLKQNYDAGNNEELFNLLKEKDSLVALNAAVNALTADDVFNRFNFEDMTMMRELNADVNDKLFNDKSAHLTTSGSIAPFYFESGMGSNARYALYNTRIGRKSVGLSLALSNVNSRDRHDNNSRKDETFQMSVPFGYNRYGFKFITAPRFGYAYGTYDRNGYNHTYDGTVEKRMMGLMNETRYPIDMGGWSLSPAAEFNMLGYHVKGHEDGAPFALSIKSQNNYSVEAGLGLYANKNITLGTNHKLQMRAGVAAYHEFADPYTTELEMQGMNGSFKIRDERRKNQRVVVRAGFDYNFGSDFSLMGAIASYIDGTTHTNANLDFKYHF
ncbi:MAG: hypothetical protein IKR92_04095 [Alphaproteobacteria bacterium]|nr:hypothetical protein [Alphaproteobacteria bacterium]